jgi:hypothetical protein
MVNRAMVHLSQGVRHRAEGCVALRQNLARVDNGPFGESDSTLLYSCQPPTSGTVGGDILDPFYSWDQKWISRKRKLVKKSLKERETPFKGVLYKKFFSGGLRAVAHHQGALEEPVNPLLRFKPGSQQF